MERRRNNTTNKHKTAATHLFQSFVKGDNADGLALGSTQEQIADERRDGEGSGHDQHPRLLHRPRFRLRGHLGGAEKPLGGH